MLCALPALWVGLIYEPQAQAQALALVSDWTAEEREYLRVEVRGLGEGEGRGRGNVCTVCLSEVCLSAKLCVNLTLHAGLCDFVVDWALTVIPPL